MRLSLRRRILLTLTPLLLLLAILGGAGVVLLERLGHRINAIMRENYDSVRAMEQLNEALERIDSSFQFALVGKESDALESFTASWAHYHEQLRVEEKNITIYPDEPRLVAELQELTTIYEQRGKEFFAKRPNDPTRPEDYFRKSDPHSLYAVFLDIKKVSNDILLLNQRNMEQANRDAQRWARYSVIGFAMGLGTVALLAAWFTRRLIHTILRPIEAVTRSAESIGAGQLNRTVPVIGADELARLADAFNAMCDRLRYLRQTNTARLLRLQETSQATIDSFPDPILVIDTEGQVELVNPAAIQVFGVHPATDTVRIAWQPPEMLRQPVSDALELQRSYLTQAFGQTLSFRINGEERDYLPQVRPIRDPNGATLGAAVVLNDVTQFRLLDQFKTDLVATVSHELKTPLTTIRLAIHVMLEETVGTLNAKQTELLLDARENTERLLQIIEHLLALARLQEGHESLRLQPESPAALLRSAAETHAGRAEDKHLEIVIEAPEDLPNIQVDPGRFGHALGNLIDNAIAYTEPGGKITLHASRENNQLLLRVSDTGIGIPPEHVPHVFDRFFRIPGHSSPHGTGLGLAIVREVVRAHHGEITCKSTPGKGTVFTINLPLPGGEK